MKFDEFLTKVDSYHNDNKSLRYGQTIINVLYEVWPEKYKELIGTDHDCFYDDSTARFTLDKLEKEWNDAVPSIREDKK